MFENLSLKLERAFKVLKGNGSITDINIAETVKEVRRALIDADVSYPIAKEFTDKVKAEALGRNVIGSIEPGLKWALAWLLSRGHTLVRTDLSLA